MKVLKHGVEVEIPDESVAGNLKMFPNAFSLLPGTELPKEAPVEVEVKGTENQEEVKKKKK